MLVKVEIVRRNDLGLVNLKHRYSFKIGDKIIGSIPANNDTWAMIEIARLNINLNRLLYAPAQWIPAQNITKYKLEVIGEVFVEGGKK